jgi:hypothetical protein
MRPVPIAPRTPVRRTFANRPLAFSLTATITVLMLATAAPALGKENLEARLDAPVARNSPGGAEILVGVTVTFTDASGVHPVEGSPVSVHLIGPSGLEQWEMARADPKPGHYTARVEVPADGVSSVLVGFRGTNGNGAAEIPIAIVGQTVTAGGMTAGSAQLAPAPPRAITPLPRATVAAAAPAAPAAVHDAAAGPSIGVVPVIVVVLLGVACSLGIVVLARRRITAGRAPVRPAPRT